MTYTLIAPLGKGGGDILSVLGQYHIVQVVLLPAAEHQKYADRLRRALEKVRMPVLVEVVLGSFMDSLISVIKSRSSSSIIIHAGCAGESAAIAAVSVGYMFGVKVIAGNGQQQVELPVMRMGYREMLSEKKKGVLRIIAAKGVLSSLEALAAETNMSLPLVSYHLYGNAKTKGLLSLGLVHVLTQNGKTQVSLSALGKLLA